MNVTLTESSVVARSIMNSFKLGLPLNQSRISPNFSETRIDLQFQFISVTEHARKFANSHIKRWGKGKGNGVTSFMCWSVAYTVLINLIKINAVRYTRGANVVL